MRFIRSKHLPVLVGIGVLAVIAYLPTLTQPFIEDDYANIKLARAYGPVAGWSQMMSDDVNRVRATTWIMTYWIDKVSGFQPWAFYATGILLHVLNCWLIYSFGRVSQVGYGVSGWAAAYFAVQEGHQEAIMWYSASNELLLFLFGVSCLLALLKFLESEDFHWRWYALSLLLFVFALASKESSVIFVPLLVLMTLSFGVFEKRALYAGPFGLLAIIYAALIFSARQHSFRFSDQSFELDAPFWITWSRSFFALLWFWGILSIAVLVIWRRQLRLLLFALCWIGVSFVPYMFVAYMHRIPSRQTYLASFGLALIVGAAITVLFERYNGRKVWIAYAIVTVILIHNVGYLWIKKRLQYLERADPTEQLVRFARETDGPVYVRCFPRDRLHAESAIELRLGLPADKLVWDENTAASRDAIHSFCYDEQTRTVDTK